MHPFFASACIFSLCLATSAVAAGADPFAPVKGIWLTEDKSGAVELYPCGDELCGKFHWLKLEPGATASADRDDKNPNPELRNRPLCGMQFMGGFKPEGDGEFTGGWIYSPRHGARFSSEIRASGTDALELRGYMLLPILGESQTWTKADKIPSCTPQHDAVNKRPGSNRT
ncbi:MAG: DUF2147 domain-containing protein [Alphaproteobacteria bacterium]